MLRMLLLLRTDQAEVPADLTVLLCAQGRFTEAKEMAARIRPGLDIGPIPQDIPASVEAARNAARDARIRYRAHPVPDASERAYRTASSTPAAVIHRFGVAARPCRVRRNLGDVRR